MVSIPGLVRTVEQGRAPRAITIFLDGRRTFDTVSQINTSHELLRLNMQVRRRILNFLVCKKTNFRALTTGIADNANSSLAYHRGSVLSAWLSV